jgi:hypothetical protein
VGDREQELGVHGQRGQEQQRRERDPGAGGQLEQRAAHHVVETPAQAAAGYGYVRMYSYVVPALVDPRLDACDLCRWCYEKIRISDQFL